MDEGNNLFYYYNYFLGFIQNELKSLNLWDNNLRGVNKSVR